MANTSLGKLSRRRPDLGNLQLTCANSSIILLYTNLASEVIESFIVDLDSYSSDVSMPKQATIDVFNIDPSECGSGGSAGRLLAQAENTDYNSYIALNNAVAQQRNYRITSHLM